MTRYFKNSEYFGKKERDIPQEHYENWGILSGILTTFRLLFKQPILIVKGYDAYRNGKGAVIRPQNGNHSGLWSSVNLFLETNRQALSSVRRLANNWIEVIVK